MFLRCGCFMSTWSECFTEYEIVQGKPSNVAMTSKNKPIPPFKATYYP